VKYLYKGMITCFSHPNPAVHYVQFAQLQVEPLAVLVELFIRAVCCHSLRKNVQLCVRQEGFYIRKGVANACDRSLRQEFDHFFRGFTESLEQGPRARLAFFWGIHHIH
jgi:hypothetical protein